MAETTRENSPVILYCHKSSVKSFARFIWWIWSH